MSPLPRLHHHDIMTIVGLFTYRLLHMSRNVGALKVANLHCSRQQCVVAEWSGCSIAFRVRVRVREWDLSLLFLRVTKELHCGTVQKNNSTTVIMS